MLLLLAADSRVKKSVHSAVHLWGRWQRGLCGHLCRISVEKLRKFAKCCFIVSGMVAEVQRKVCRNVREIFRQISAATPSQTTP